MDWSRLVGWQDPWSTGELPLADAWQRCPDARWLFASATYGGVASHILVGCVARCAREVVDVEAYGWSPFLDEADKYAAGGEAQPLVDCLVALTDAAGAKPTTERLRSIAAELGERESIAAYTMAADLAMTNLLRALHPDVPNVERARAGADALGFLAALAALDARRQSRQSAEKMLAETTSELGGASLATLAGRAVIDRESSPFWDDAAARAFTHALQSCADIIRELVSSPY